MNTWHSYKRIDRRAVSHSEGFIGFFAITQTPGKAENPLLSVCITIILFKLLSAANREL